MSNWNTFKNKTVLVTGASSGIGLALVEKLADRGAKVILVARSAEKLEAKAKALNSEGKEAHAFPCDLSETGAAAKLHAEIKAKGLEVDLLINNAGYGRWGAFLDFDRPDYAKMIQLNITALTELCHVYLPDMVAKGKGGIINVGSTASFLPVPYANVYSATKAYVLSFTEALEFEYRDKGIRTMALCPGGTASAFASTATEKSESTRERASQRSDQTKYQSSEEVAEECLEAFMTQKIYHISGKHNRRQIALTRLFSRKKVTSLAGKQFKTLTGN